MNKKKGYIGCFLIENDSFLEIRDCFIKSVKDPSQIEKEKEEVIMKSIEGNPLIELTDVEDCCFCMNINSIIPASKENKRSEIELSPEYVGVISL